LIAVRAAVDVGSRREQELVRAQEVTELGVVVVDVLDEVGRERAHVLRELGGHGRALVGRRRVDHDEHDIGRLHARLELAEVLDRRRLLREQVRESANSGRWNAIR